MADIGTSNPRIAHQPHRAKHRRAMELLMLGAASLAFLFSLAVAIGFVSG